MNIILIIIYIIRVFKHNIQFHKFLNNNNNKYKWMHKLKYNKTSFSKEIYNSYIKIIKIQLKIINKYKRILNKWINKLT